MTLSESRYGESPPASYYEPPDEYDPPTESRWTCECGWESDWIDDEDDQPEYTACPESLGTCGICTGPSDHESPQRETRDKEPDEPDFDEDDLRR